MPIVSLDIINDKISDKEINYFSIDSCVIIRKNFDFSNTPLSRINHSKLKNIIPEVIKNELITHFDSKIKDSSGKLIKEVNLIKKLTGLDLINYNELEKQLNISTKTSDFYKYLNNSVQLAHSDIDVEVILDSYFKAIPPFKNAKDKKTEFPDAIALETLELWAKNNRHKILIISTDFDWIEYCNKSQNLFSIDEYEPQKSNEDSYINNSLSALLIIQHYRVKPDKTLDSLLSDNDFKKYITALIEDELDGNFNVNADSNFYWEADNQYCVVNEIHWKDTQKFIKLEELKENDHVQYDVEITVSFTAYATFYLSIWDSIDKEYESFSTEEVSTDSEIDLTITIGIEVVTRKSGCIYINPIIDIEKLSPETLYFGEIEPYFGPDDDSVS